MIRVVFSGAASSNEYIDAENDLASLVAAYRNHSYAAPIILRSAGWAVMLAAGHVMRIFN